MAQAGALYFQVMNVPLSPIRCLYRGVDLYPKKVGVVSGDCRYTYAQFGERCERLASGLHSAGVRPATASPISASTTTSFWKATFGVLLAGAIVMPLNVRLTPAELTGILNHAEPRIADLRIRLRPAGRATAAGLPGHRAVLDRNRAEPYEELLSHGRVRAPGPLLHRRERDRRTVLHQRQHRHAEGRHALASHRISARALLRRIVQLTTTTPWNCTPSRCSTPTAGDAPHTSTMIGLSR